MLLQALYQWQLTGHELAELRHQFAGQPAYARIDRDYFDAQLQCIVEGAAGLDETIAAAADRPVVQLDPVEHAVLWIGLAELTQRTDDTRRALQWADAPHVPDELTDFFGDGRTARRATLTHASPVV